jgi:glycosidase
VIRERLQFLYGQQAGARAAADLERLLADFRPRLPAPAAGRHAFDENDALLITYGDSFLTPGQAPLHSLKEFADRYLTVVVPGIHLLPFFPYSSDYGFSVVDFERVNPELGDWGAVEALRGGFGLMFDFVLNHVSAESEWFQAFLRGEPPYDGFFITEDPATDLSAVTRPRTSPLLTRFETARGPRWLWTTFSADQVDLNYHNPAVLLRMIEVMLGYIERGAGLLRLDAVGYLWKEAGTSCSHLPQTHEVVRLLREVLDAVAPQVAIVTETNVPHRDNVSYFGDGRNEAQMVYQFPLAPLVLDAFATGESTRLGAWAASVQPPSDGTTFFNFLASHDGIGVVPARGRLSEAGVAALVDQVRRHGGDVSFKTNPDGTEAPYELNTTFFDALSDPRDEAEAEAIKVDRFMCSQAVMLALAGVPGVYVHSLFGSPNDQEGYRRSGWKRDLNHERLGLPELHRALATPSTRAAQVFWRFAGLLRARRGEPAFHPNAPQQVLETPAGVFGLERGPRAGRTAQTFHNLTAQPRTIRLSSPGHDLLAGRQLAPSVPVALGPYQVLWVSASPREQGPRRAS